MLCTSEIITHDMALYCTVHRRVTVLQYTKNAQNSSCSYIPTWLKNWFQSQIFPLNTTLNRKLIMSSIDGIWYGMKIRHTLLIACKCKWPSWFLLATPQMALLQKWWWWWWYYCVQYSSERGGWTAQKISGTENKVTPFSEYLVTRKKTLHHKQNVIL